MSEYDLRARLLKVLAITGFLLTAVLAVTASSSHADGYEISLYAAYPGWFWYGIVAGFGIGATLVLAARPTENRRLYLGLGVAVMVLTNALLLFMPAIRGYFAYGVGDVLTHRGHVLDVLETGHVSEGNFYPGIHVHAVLAMRLTGLDFFTVKDVLVPAYSLTYWSGFVLLARRLTDRRPRFHYALPLVLLPVFKNTELYFGPNRVGFSLYPLFLFALFGVWRARERYVAVVVTVLSFVVFTHPMTTLLAVFTIGLVGASRLLTSELEGQRLAVKRSLPVLTIPIVVLIAFFEWYYSFFAILYATVSHLAELVVGTGAAQIRGYSRALGNVPLGLVDVLEVVVFRKGSEVALVVLGLASAGYLASRYREGAARFRWEYSFAIASFGAFSAIAALFLFNPVTITWSRYLKYAQFYAVLLGVLATFAYLRTLGGERRERILVALCLFAVVSLATLVVFGFYPSPLGRETNPHLPASRFEGMEWFLDHRDPDRSAYGFSYRYEDALYGVVPSHRTYTGRQVPPHFGYQNAPTFATGERVGSYLLVTEKLEQYYPSLHPEYRQYWQYFPSNFRRLDRDRGLVQIYANGGLDIYETSNATSR